MSNHSNIQPQEKNTLPIQLLGFVAGFGATVGLEFLILAALNRMPRGLGWILVPIMAGIALARAAPALAESLSKWRAQWARRSSNAASVGTTRAAIANPAEELLWTSVSNEFEGQSRKPGLWAKAYASAEGNEALAKAKYLKWRVDELSAEEQRQASEEVGRQQKNRVEQLARAAAKCPSCDKLIPMSHAQCPSCRASFAQGSPWNNVPL